MAKPLLHNVSQWKLMMSSVHPANFYFKLIQFSSPGLGLGLPRAPFHLEKAFGSLRVGKGSLSSPNIIVRLSTSGLGPLAANNSAFYFFAIKDFHPNPKTPEGFLRAKGIPREP